MLVQPKIYGSLGSFISDQMPTMRRNYVDGMRLKFNRSSFMLDLVSGGTIPGAFRYQRDLKPRSYSVDIDAIEKQMRISRFPSPLMMIASQVAMQRGWCNSNPLSLHSAAYMSGHPLIIPELYTNSDFDDVYTYPLTDNPEDLTSYLPRFAALLKKLFPDANKQDRHVIGEYGFGRYRQALLTATEHGFITLGIEVDETHLERLKKIPKKNLTGIQVKPDQAVRFPFLDLVIWSNLDPYLSWLPWEMLTANVQHGGYMILIRESRSLPQLPPEMERQHWKLLDRRHGHLLPSFLDDQEDKALLVDIWKRLY